MIRALIENQTGLVGPQLHLVFLGLFGAAAATVLLAALGLVLRKRPGGPITRLLAVTSSLLSASALLLAFDTLPLQAHLDWQVIYAVVGFLAATSVLVGMTAAAGRSGVILSAVQGCFSLGLIIQLVLITATRRADPMFQIGHYSDLLVFGTVGFLLLLAVGYVSSKRQGGLVTGLYILVAALGAAALARSIGAHPAPGASLWVLGGLPLLATAAWLWWLQRSRQRAGTGLVSDGLRSVRRIAVRAQDHPLVIVALVAAPVLAALAGLAMGDTGGSAREASRVTVLGVGVTPNLFAPFLFAPALGMLLGRKPSRWNVPMALGLTVVLAGVMMAQKEVGNTAVILITAAVVFLVVRGTVTHLAIGAALGVAALVVGYILAPVVDEIPYTLYERVQLWAGRPDLMRNGGSLVAASHITYDVGGFWGVGIHDTSPINLHALIGAIDTDFPLTVLGHAGGIILLCSYVGFFLALGLMLLHTLLCLDWATDRRRARWQAPILAGLFAVPVASTIINLTGAVAQVAPFTGIPAVFASYSTTFVLGCFVLVAFFVMVGNRAVLRSTLKRRAERDAMTERVMSSPLIPLPTLAGAGAGAGASRSTALGLDPSFASAANDDVPVGGPAPTPEPYAGGTPRVLPSDVIRARWVSGRFALRRLLRRTRFRTVDGGIYLMMLGLPVFGAYLGDTLYQRYTDPALHYSHPRLVSELRIEPVVQSDGPLRWRVVDGPDTVETAMLEDGDELRVDSLLLRYRSGRLDLVGQCFDEAQLERGVRIGFAGLLDAPRLPMFETEVREALSSLAPMPVRNDIVLAEGDVAMEHLVVRGVGYDRFVLDKASEAGAFEVVDRDGKVIPDGVPRIRLGQGFRIGTTTPRTFMIERHADETCLISRRTPLEAYALSAVGPTVLSGRPVLRRAGNQRTIDFEYAEKIKIAAESGILGYDASARRLTVIPWDKDSRAKWDDATRRNFEAVFDIVRIELEDGRQIERLAWTRPFYADGGRAFDPGRELEIFSVHQGRVMGLADSRRFSRPLPTGRPIIDVERQGVLLDRYGEPLVELDVEQSRILSTFPGGASLVGYAFEDRATRDGLLRVFASVLHGVQPPPDPRAELEDMLGGKRGGPWGADVHTTLDPQVQQIALDVVRDEVEKLTKKEPETIHHASAIVLGPRNEILAAVQMPDAGEVTTLEDAVALKQRQLQAPMDAPALDAFHRVTTLGSTIKLLTTIAAFRHKEDTMIADAKGELWIKAFEKGGRMADHGGVLTNWRGIGIVPIKNYGGQAFGKAISVREMLVRSVNTAAAYLGLNVGKERYLAFTDDIGIRPGLDLLPQELGPEGRYGHLVDRFRFDPVTMSPAPIAVIPENERWTLSYTARLALSGMSDYSVLHVAAGVSIVARDGLYYPPRIVTGLRHKKDGVVEPLSVAEPVRILPVEDAQLIESYMLETVEGGTARLIRSSLPDEIWKEAGAKTGTGETVTPVNPNAVYSRLNKPATRDNKVLVAIWPASSPDAYVIAVVYEEISHLDTRVAVRSVARIIEGLAIRDGLIEPAAPETEAAASKPAKSKRAQPRSAARASRETPSEPAEPPAPAAPPAGSGVAIAAEPGRRP